MKHQLREGPKDGPCMKFSEAQSMLQERFGLEVITTREASKVLQQAFPNCITDRSTYILGVRRIPVPNPSVPHSVSSDSVSFPQLLVTSCIKFHYMVADGTKIMHAHTGIMLTNGECPTSFESCGLGARTLHNSEDPRSQFLPLTSNCNDLCCRTH